MDLFSFTNTIGFLPAVKNVFVFAVPFKKERPSQVSRFLSNKKNSSRGPTPNQQEEERLEMDRSSSFMSPNSTFGRMKIHPPMFRSTAPPEKKNREVGDGDRGLKRTCEK